MMPKHSNPTRRRDKDGSWATAPYNFVPLYKKIYTVEEDSIQNQDSFTGNTGYIDCTLTTESPLYIRCGMTPEFFRKNHEKTYGELNPDEKNEMAQFFHLNDSNNPVIPGSSLRGMIRTLVEIAGYGKVQWVTNDEKITYRAVAASRDDPLSLPYMDFIGKYGRNLKAGYLFKKESEWFIQPAKKPSDIGLNGKDQYIKVKEKYIQMDELPAYINFNDEQYLPQYHEVSFNASLITSKHGKFISVSRVGSLDKGYNYKGILVCSGNMRETGSDKPSPRSSHVLVLEIDPDAKQLSISNEVIKAYVGSLTPFQKEKPFSDKIGCLKEGHPVFYVSKGDKVLFFGHNPYFRVPAIQPGTNKVATPNAFVPEDLRNPAEIDIAEAIFGYAPDKKQKQANPSASNLLNQDYAQNKKQKQGRAGRVFFTDAAMEKSKGPIWLTDSPITPKILASPKTTTFQHYLVQDKSIGHDPDYKEKLAHYATPTDETVIRGFKLYWHKNDVKEADIKETEEIDDKDTQHTLIRPVNKDVVFNFRIYFENLEDYELGALLWALALPGEEGKEYRHKLGMGKPLGMGSIRIKPTLHVSDRKMRYNRLFEVDSDEFYEGMGLHADVQEFIQLFEYVILDFLKSGNNRLHETERIQMLLKMLEWPGPDNKDTRYLSIQSTNQYKERPVLPDPFNIKRPEK